MNIFKFEFIKLIKKKVFLILFAALILANLLALHIYEQKRPAYYYIYEGREKYESFVSGELEIDDEGFYEADKLEQEAHIENYHTFLQGMEERAQNLYVVSGEDSFVYKNAKKTCDDFEHLTDIKLVADNCFGIRELMQYDLSIFFLLAFIAIVSYFLFYEERDKGLLLLIKGTKNGHGPLILSKIGLMGILVSIYTILQETANVFMFHYYFGYGDLGRSIQSIPEFRNCPYELSVGIGIVVMILVRVLIALLLAMFVAFLSIAIRNELTVLAAGGCVLLSSAVLCSAIPISSSFNILKCINAFYFWNMEQMLAVYQNLNLFGNAVGKADVALVVACVGIVVCVASGVMIFHISCQTRKQSRLEAVVLWIRKKTGKLWRHTSLLRFEIHKVAFQQKRLVAMLFLLVVCLLNVFNTQETYYSTPYRATYNAYLHQINGKVTEQSIAFVHEKEAYVEGLYEQLYAIEDPTGSDYLLSLMIQVELDKTESAVYQLSQQLNMLQNMEGSIYDKYWINELSYMDLWCDAQSDVLWWFAGSAVMVLWISGVYPADEKRKIMPLLNSTKNGRNILAKKKNLSILIGGVAAFIFAELPCFLKYYEIDSFQCLSQKLYHFTTLSCSSNWTVGFFLGVIFTLKLLSFVVVALVAVYVSKKTKNEIITNIVGIGLVGIVAIICFSLNVNISMTLINLLCL